MAQMTPEQMQTLKNQMREYVSKYIEKNPTDMFKLAEVTGLYTPAILAAVNNPDVEFRVIADIYTAYRQLQEPEKEETQEEKETELTTPQGSEEDLGDTIEYIKNHIKFNPTDIFDIAEKSGLTPQEVVTRINKEGSTMSELSTIYETIKGINAERSAKAASKMSQK